MSDKHSGKKRCKKIHVLEGSEILELVLLSRDVSEKSVQPVSIELEVETICELQGIARNGKNYLEFPIRSIDDLPLCLEVKHMSNEKYILKVGKAYLVTLKPRVKMPSNCFGVLLPRSSLQRCGVVAQGTLIDPGYEGNLKVLLYPTVMNIELPRGERLFHMIVFCRDKTFTKTYNGLYQGEK